MMQILRAAFKPLPTEGTLLLENSLEWRSLGWGGK